MRPRLVYGVPGGRTAVPSWNLLPEQMVACRARRSWTSCSDCSAARLRIAFGGRALQLLREVYAIAATMWQPEYDEGNNDWNR